MTTQNPKTLEFGCWFPPPESKRAPGGFRLEIMLPESPAGVYITPRSVHLSVKSRQGFPEKLKITHPWSFGKTCQLLPGVIEIIAADSEKLEALSLGGSLEIDKFDHSHHKEDPQLLQLIQFLNAEKRRLQYEGLLPILIPSLEDLL